MIGSGMAVNYSKEIIMMFVGLAVFMISMVMD